MFGLQDALRGIRKRYMIRLERWLSSYKEVECWLLLDRTGVIPRHCRRGSQLPLIWFLLTACTHMQAHTLFLLFSSASIRHHEQGNLQEMEFIGGLQFQGVRVHCCGNSFNQRPLNQPTLCLVSGRRKVCMALLAPGFGSSSQCIQRTADCYPYCQFIPK